MLRISPSNYGPLNFQPDRSCFGASCQAVGRAFYHWDWICKSCIESLAFKASKPRSTSRLRMKSPKPCKSMCHVPPACSHNLYLGLLHQLSFSYLESQVAPDLLNLADGRESVTWPLHLVPRTIGKSRSFLQRQKCR